MGEKRNKRDLILEAAKEIFLEKGYYGATSEEIAKQAGIGKGTIYQYFASKQEIFEEMHRVYIMQYGDGIAACIADDSTFLENLRRIVHFHMHNIEIMARYNIQLLMEITPRPNAQDQVGRATLKEAGEKLQDTLQHMIDVGLHRGEIRQVNSRLLLSYLIGILLGCAHLMIMGGLSDEEKIKIEEEMVQNILHGIAS